MPTGLAIHGGDPPYAPPLLRAASPSSSIGTEYAPDETSSDEASMSPEEFAHMCEQRLLLRLPREDELSANEDPLLPKPKTPQEEKALLEKVMQNLRMKVRQLEEDELFEQALLRGSQVAQERQPSSSDIDAIMRSIMVPPSRTNHGSKSFTERPSTFASGTETPGHVQNEGIVGSNVATVIPGNGQSGMQDTTRQFGPP